MPQRNKHRRPKTSRRRLTHVAIATGASVALPALAAVPASAASASAWDKIAECESSGRWDLPYGDADSTGGLQIQKRTWDDFNGPSLTGAAYPYQATKAQQIQVAELILAQQGPQAWSCNAMTGYPLSTQGAGALPESASVSVTAAAPEAPPSPERTQAPPTTGQGSTTYRVMGGDTLYGIARAQTGDTSSDNWRSLYDANRQVIGEDPNAIEPGQILRIPEPRPVSEPESTPTVPDASPTAPEEAAYQLPVKGWISQSFGNSSAGYTLGYHTGTDFAAPAGTPLVAVTAGSVVESDPSSAYGTNVQIRHDDGTYTLYAHLSGKTVSAGERVAAGGLIGYVGSTGTSSGPHLHMEGRTSPTFADGNFFDVVPWLRSHGVQV
ncbi:peptidoglycan DD-metalloendopeptidase family protein [Streptomyces sp. NPDC057101]|uniref:peptidoglycan DD-metalloendopeptidase family protein n=1 Tax=Streptomyces sp. NPDC057101 TaxID=3346020 RepID=UPI0036445835